MINKSQNNLPKKYVSSVYSELSVKSISSAIKEFNEDNLPIVIVCIGSDYVVGDSLGPLTGTFLQQNNLAGCVFGTLKCPITANTVESANLFLRKKYKGYKIIAVDAGVGEKDEVGNVYVTNRGLKPGLGVDKDLKEIGDISIIGVIAEKTTSNKVLYYSTRLNLVYKMATVIANGICSANKAVLRQEISV